MGINGQTRRFLNTQNTVFVLLYYVHFESLINKKTAVRRFIINNSLSILYRYDRSL